MTHRIRVVVAVCCAVGLLGCGNEGETVDQYAARLAGARCANLFRCEQRGGASQRARYGTEANCVAVMVDGNFSPWDAPEVWVDAGRVRLDHDAVERCIELWGASCSESLERSEVCDALFVGRVADGDGCIEDLECTSGVCSGSADACGACVPRVPLGAPCADDVPCAGSETGTVACVSPDDGGPSVCTVVDPLVEDGALGDSCLLGPAGSGACAAGLICADGTCAARVAVGEPCDQFRDTCAFGATCAADSATCVPVRVVANVGDRCGRHPGEFIACDVSAGLVCAADVCVEVAPGTEGEPCSNGCAPGLFCEVDTCRSLKPMGGGCISFHQCESGYCDISRGMCAEWPSCP